MKFKPILGCWTFILFSLIVLLIANWMVGFFGGGRCGGRLGARESMENPNPNPNPYVLTNVISDDSPKEAWEKIQTVDSAGSYSTAMYDVQIHSRETIQCIAPAAYNSNTFECDCPIGSDYSNVYGCISKCQPHERYVDDSSGLGGGLGRCEKRCNDENNEYYDISANRCLVCPPNMRADGNNHCIPRAPCPTAGGFYDASGACTYCPDGQKYSDVDQTCVTACLDFQTYRNGQCAQRCPIQSQQWTAIGCVNCPTGMITNSRNECVVNPNTCRPGEAYDANNECASVCLNYERWNQEMKNCIPKCGENQYYHTGTESCALCPIGQYTDGHNGCVTPHVTPMPTPNCSPGFQVDATATWCETKCPYWRYNAEDDPTECEMLCPVRTQYYEKDTNNGCADCPVGYITDEHNQCSLCDEDKGYTMGDVNVNGTIQKKCTFECKPYQFWNASTNVCDYDCPYNNMYYDVDTNKGCLYCPKGYLVNSENQCVICDISNGYFPNGKDAKGNDRCEQRCHDWQRWDNTKQRCINHCNMNSVNKYYDTDTDACVPCKDIYPNNYILGFDVSNNACVVGSVFTNAPPAITPAPYVPTNAPTTPAPTNPPPTVSSFSVNYKLLDTTLQPNSILAASFQMSLQFVIEGSSIYYYSIVGPNNSTIIIKTAYTGNTTTSITVNMVPGTIYQCILKVYDADGNEKPTNDNNKMNISISKIQKPSVVPSNSIIMTYQLAGGGGGGGGGGGQVSNRGSGPFAQTHVHRGHSGGKGGKGEENINKQVISPDKYNKTVGLFGGTGGAGGSGGTEGNNGRNGNPGSASVIKIDNIDFAQAGGGGGGGFGPLGDNPCDGGACQDGPNAGNGNGGLGGSGGNGGGDGGNGGNGGNGWGDYYVYYFDMPYEATNVVNF